MDNVITDTDVTMAETVAPEDQEDNGTPPTDSTTTNTNPGKKDDSNLAQVTLVNFDGGNDANETGEQESVVPKTEKDLEKSPDKQSNGTSVITTDTDLNTEESSIQQDEIADATETDEGLFDEARPEATFSYTVLDFPNLKESALSPPTMVSYIF